MMMWIVLRNRLIGIGFRSWAWSVRLRRRLVGFGRLRLGALEHVTIPVTDLAGARHFYCEVLGAAHLMTVDDETFRRFGRPPAENNGEGAHHVSVLVGGSTRLDLFLQGSGQPKAAAGHPHFAFAVRPGQLMRWRARLDAAGIPSDGPLQLGPPGQASLYFNDPFGNHLEIVCLGFARPVPIRPPDMARLVRQQP